MRLSRRLAPVACLAVLLAVVACDATPAHFEEANRRRELAAKGLDGSGGHRLAGMSAYRKIEIEELDPKDAADLRGDSAFHTYHMRCGSCHDVPAPASKPAYLWDAALSRMQKNATDAGLMPLLERDQAEIRRFLREHGAAAP